MAENDLPSPVIRPATLHDIDTLASFSTQIAIDTEDLVLDPATVHKGVTAIVQNANLGLCFVAEIDGKLAGQSMVTYEWSDWKCGTTWWFQSVYVDPAFRRRGIFKALYQHIKQEAKKQGAVGLKLYAFNTNKKAHAAYEKLGMISHNVVYEDPNF